MTSTLQGKTVLVTRAGKQAQDLANLLKEHGALTIEISMIEFGPPSSWHDLDTALGALPNFDWIIFASKNAVSAFHDRLMKLSLNLPSEGTQIAAIGSSTQKALQDLGIKVDFVPTSFVAEGFVSEFSNRIDVKEKRILWPRTNAGRKFISEQLAELGANVTEVEAYTTNLPVDADTVSTKLADLIVENKIDVVTLASSQTARNFCDLLKVGLKTRFDLQDSELETAIRHHTKDVLFAAIGPITAGTTRGLLGRADIEAETFSAAGLVAQLLRFYGADHS